MTTNKPKNPASVRQGSSTINHRLGQVFPEGRVFAVCDDEWLGLAANYYGLVAVDVTDLPRLPHAANVVLFLRNQLVSKEIRNALRNARVLVVPIASFDPSLEAALYTQKLAMVSDYASACHRASYWLDAFTTEQGPLIFYSEDNGTHLTCSLTDDLDVDALPVPTIDTGGWISVGSYCEVALTNHPKKNLYSFIVNGTATVCGVLVARDARYTEEGDRRIRSAVRLREDLMAHSPVSLRVEDSVLREVKAGGEDFTEAVRDATNPRYGLQALELGLGTNSDVLPSVHWTVNSQLNEGAGPVHLGFGDGITGAHMDFLIADVVHQFGHES